MVNSLTAKSVLAGTKNYPSVDFLRRNSTFFIVSTAHKQHHHSAASSGADLIVTPDPAQMRGGRVVEGGVGRSDSIESINW